MRRACGQAGSSLVEYLGVVAAVALVFVGLLALSDHRVGREAPVDPVAQIVRVLGPPAPPARRSAPRARPAAPARPRPRRPPRPPRPVVEVPTWAIGGW